MKKQALGRRRYQDRIAVLVTGYFVFPIPNFISPLLSPLFSSSTTSSYKEGLDLWQTQSLSWICLEDWGACSSTESATSKHLPSAIVTLFSRTCSTMLSSGGSSSSIPCRQSLLDQRSWLSAILELCDFGLAADFGSQSILSAQQLRQLFHVPSKSHWLMTSSVKCS